MEVEQRIPSQRDTSMQPEQLVSLGENGLVVAFRPEKSDFEVTQHSDSPHHCAALHVVLAGSCLEARKETFPARELHEHGGPLASRALEPTGPEGLPA